MVQVAIDGPASSGKSTVAKIIARNLNWTYLDTGAMYRVASLISILEQTDDGEKILNHLHESPIKFDGEQVFSGNENVTSAIRGQEVTQKVSEISAKPIIRAFMVKEQQRIANSQNIIMDGRDIGTVVLPKADLKIFLVADVKERALRRYKENLEKGIPSNLTELESQIAARDVYDSTRKTSPLEQATDAVRLDTTGMSIYEVVENIENKIKMLL